MSFKIYQVIKKEAKDGIVIKKAIIVPFTRILFSIFLLEFNSFLSSFGNKNQKYFIFGKKNFL